MTNEQIKAEFSRWLDAGQQSVWVRCYDGRDWEIVTKPSWKIGCNFIVNDKHAELRKLQIDEPNTKFQFYSKADNQWQNCVEEPVWHQDCVYRVKPKEWYEDIPDNGVLCYVTNRLGIQHQKENVAIITKHAKNEVDGFRFFNTDGKFWLFAKPVTCDNLYKEK